MALTRSLTTMIANPPWDLLTTLHLQLFHTSQVVSPAHLVDYQSVLNLRGIEDFSFTCDHGVHVSAADIILLLESWPNLRRLILSSTPVDDEEAEGIITSAQDLGIEILDVFVEKCPRIEELGFNFNHVVPQILDSTSVLRLKYLQRLEVSRSSWIEVEAGSWLYKRLTSSTRITWNGDELLNGSPPSSGALSWSATAIALETLHGGEDNLLDGYWH